MEKQEEKSRGGIFGLKLFGLIVVALVLVFGGSWVADTVWFQPTHPKITITKSVKLYHLDEMVQYADGEGYGVMKETETAVKGVVLVVFDPIKTADGAFFRVQLPSKCALFACDAMGLVAAKDLPQNDWVKSNTPKSFVQKMRESVPLYGTIAQVRAGATKIRLGSPVPDKEHEGMWILSDEGRLSPNKHIMYMGFYKGYMENLVRICVYEQDQTECFMKDVKAQAVPRTDLVGDFPNTPTGAEEEDAREKLMEKLTFVGIGIGAVLFIALIFIFLWRHERASKKVGQQNRALANRSHWFARVFGSGSGRGRYPEVQATQEAVQDGKVQQRLANAQPQVDTLEQAQRHQNVRNRGWSKLKKPAEQEAAPFKPLPKKN